MPKIMLNGVDYSAPVVSGVSGVKGNTESEYRKGNVNLTPQNIGALSLSGGTMNDGATIFMKGTDTSIDIAASDYNTQMSYNLVSVSGLDSNKQLTCSSIHPDKIMTNKITSTTDNAVKNVSISYNTIDILNEHPGITKYNTQIQPHIISIQTDDIESKYYRNTTIGGYYAVFQNEQTDDDIFNKITISSNLNNRCGIEAINSEISDNTRNFTSGIYFDSGDVFTEIDGVIKIKFYDHVSNKIQENYTIEPSKIIPDNDNYNDLGFSTRKWRNIYATNGIIQTSDRTRKTNIASLETTQAKSFINGLNPVSYKMVDGTSERTHYGLIAQDVEELMNTLNMDSFDFAGFIKSPKKVTKYEDENGKKLKQPVEEIIEGEYDYALRYDEFIAPLIKVVQEQEEQIKKQQIEIEQLKKNVF